MTPFLPLLAAVLVAAGVPAPVPGDRRPADRDAIRAHIDEIFRAYDALAAAAAPAADRVGAELLAAREAVWRAWFANDLALCASWRPPTRWP